MFIYSSHIFRFIKLVLYRYCHFVNLSILLFKVPAFTPDQAAIPYARVNHNKYMVTEKVAYIGYNFLPLNLKSNMIIQP